MAADPFQTADVRAVWERIAGWWDDAIGDGNDFQRELIMPTTDRLLDAGPGKRIVDVACGNGNYSRVLGRRGASVVACDFCEAFLERARARTTPADGDVVYRNVDATDEAQLVALGEAAFDAAVCSMAMMDMPAIDPLLRGVRRLLKTAGRFVFSIPHPCFNSNGARMTAELANGDGRVSQTYGVAMTRYLSPTTDRSVGILHQPEPHPIFHRPLSDVLRACFDAGFVLDAFEEPAYPPEGGAKNAFSWRKRPEFPPAIVVRIRTAGPQNF